MLTVLLADTNGKPWLLLVLHGWNVLRVQPKRAYLSFQLKETNPIGFVIAAVVYFARRQMVFTAHAAGVGNMVFKITEKYYNENI